MGIGGSIFLIVVGAILAFAVDAEVGWLDLDVVGWVLMLAGLAGLILTSWLWRSRRRTVVAAPVRETRVVPQQRAEVVEEYREVRRPAPPSV
ncbi:DUF6458 family protein [Plantactinospora sp. GCM10030261]|uniref:DUF6458 family protein n=1 Tax=Plantactinospora sp. GCM10030261 TaxID=3273420 RepID=UPI0036223831